MNTNERAKLARSMGLDPAEYEKARAERAGTGAAGSMSLGARPGMGMPATNLGEALDRDRLCRAFGIKPQDFASWKLDQLQLAVDRARRGEPLTPTQTMLLGAAAVSSTPPPIIAPAAPVVTPVGSTGVMSLGAALAAVKAAAEAAGRISTARLSIPVGLG